MVVFLGVFFVGLVCASDMGVTVTVDGCNFDFNDEVLSVFAGECSDDPGRGYFFCQDGGSGNPAIPLSTLDEGLGCARGNASFVLGTPLGGCCPSGYTCEVEGSAFQCKSNLESCSVNMTELECAAVDGYYYNGECICDSYDQGCDLYISEVDCSADVMDIGKNGVGSEVCGTTVECAGENFVVPEDDCGCNWNLSLGGCYHKMNVTQGRYGVDGPDKFECSNSYSLGDCSGGSQNVSWISDYSVVNGFSGGIPAECLDAVGCNGGEATRFCGEPITKLPGFSLFALFASLFIVGLYYFAIDNKRRFNFLK